jgi:hypothetical protein
MIATELYALFDDRQTMLNSMPFPQEGSTGLDLGFTRLFLRPARHSILSGTSQQPSRSRLEAVQDFFQQPIRDGANQQGQNPASDLHRKPVVVVDSNAVMK